MKREIFSPGKERYVIFTGTGTAYFAPGMAGISYPSPEYQIERPVADNYVFEYVRRGKGYVEQDHEAFSVETGDAYILRAGRYHHYHADRRDPWEKIWFNVNGSLVRHLLSDYGLENTVKIPAMNDGHYLEEILKAIETDPVHCGNELALLIHRYILSIAEFLGNVSAEKSQALTVRKFIEQNLTVPITIDEIAAQVHLSRSRTIHMFREAYGTTPYDYYLSQKLELSQTMLKQTTLTIQEISEILGYSDYHHFSGSFKKWYGISPLQYRKQDEITKF